MNGDDKAKAAEAEEAAQREPGMGKALLAVFVMIASTLVLAALIYVVMIVIVPGERGEPRKSSEIEQPLQHAQGAGRTQN